MNKKVTHLFRSTAAGRRPPFRLTGRVPFLLHRLVCFPGRGLVLLLVAALCSAPTAVRAGCFSDVLGGDGPFAEQLERDPKGAVARVEAELATGPGRAEPGPSRAQLYAVLMDAYDHAGDVAAARQAAARGLESLAATDSAGLRRRLQLTAIKLLEQQGQIERAATDYENAAADVPDDAPDLMCVLGDRGYLRYLTGRNVDAAVDATRAYRLAKDQGRHEIQLSAGQLLARLYSQYGLYDEALALADEAVTYYAQSPKQVLLSDAYLFRGDVHLNKEDFAAADTDFRLSRTILQALDDRVALSFTVQRLCTVAAKMGDRADAPQLCHDAYDLAEAVHNPVTAKIVLLALGLIEFDRGHPRQAVDLWNRVLAHDGVDIPKGTQARLYGLRGRARAALGDAVGALQDRNVYVESLEADRKTRTAGQVALLTVRFTLALKDQEVAKARAEARTAELAAARQALVRNVVVAFALAAAAIAAAIFGAWAWHRRRLALDARRAVDERLAAIGRLTGGVAHEFNNLLSVIQQALGLLAMRDAVARDAAAMGLVQQARRASQFCADITSQLLSFARQQNLRPEAVDLDRCLREVQPLLERAAGSTVKVAVDVQATPVAWVDRRQLTAALLNLVTNARDAMPGGGTVSVRASTEPDGRIRIDVIDSGSGMPPDVLARAVEPFYSTKTVGDGSGLGLSMVQGFATQSGGRLTITSSVGEGTAVSLWLQAAGAPHA